MNTCSECNGIGVHLVECSRLIGIGGQTDRERACLRGEHEAADDPRTTAGVAVWIGDRACEAWVCRWCRALFVRRP